MNFSQLHIHNQTGSPLDGIGKIKDYVKKAKKYNHKALACTDHGSLSAIYENQTICEENGIKPIIGIEAYINNELVYKENNKRKRTKNSHITLLAKNKIGYKNLCRLNYLSNKDVDHFYYSPRITERELFENKEGVIVGSGCLNNPIANLLRQKKHKEAINSFENYVSIFDKNYFVEVHLNEIKEQKNINDFFIYMANKKGIPIVLVGDVHFLNKGDNKLQDISFAIRDGKTLDNLTFSIDAKNLYYHDVIDYISFNKEFNYNYNEEKIKEWCNNTDFIVNKCDYLLPKRKKINTPKMTNNDDIALIKKSIEGLKRKLNLENFKNCPDNYKQRLKDELEIINRKGFSSYLLVVADISDYSKKENIYGRFGRGSVGGSLVAYALDIHNIDPLKHGLLFERFINEKRTPDMVLDYFCLG